MNEKLYKVRHLAEDDGCITDEIIGYYNGWKEASEAFYDEVRTLESIKYDIDEDGHVVLLREGWTTICNEEGYYYIADVYGTDYHIIGIETEEE